MSANPVLVEVTRGSRVESQHRGSIIAVAPDGKRLIDIGKTDAPVFPRSAVKAIQALPLVESGAADAFNFDQADLALACSSHSGEPDHVSRVEAILARAGLDGTCLECGGHWSSQIQVAVEQARAYSAAPPAVCNNCSGKHSGFVCTAIHQGWDTSGYIRPDHQIQRTIRDVMSEVTGAAHDEDQCGTDGCSIPTYAVPLSSLATGFSRMVTGNGFPQERANAAARIVDACMAEPFFVAGTRRFCTDLMTLGAGRIFAKTGAEGVFCGALPGLGIGIALKCDDGGTRAAEAMMAVACANLLGEADPLWDGLMTLAKRDLRNWNGIVTGQIRPVM